MSDTTEPTPAAAIGKIERCDVRDIWPHEASDFTPWLRRAFMPRVKKLKLD